MKATRLLCDQHRRVEVLLARVAGERELRLTLMLQLVEELMTHLSIEEHVFLCRLADATGIRADAYSEDQGQVRNAVLQAVFAEENDALFSARLNELSAAFQRHAHQMERDVFPIADAQIKGADLETMGARMQKHWNAAVHGDGLPLHRHHEAAAQ